MRRGFKANAERMALSARQALGIPLSAPLDAWAYAQHLNILLLPFDSLALSDETRKQLLEVDPESWSGMTLAEGGITAIVLNPSHMKTRQASTLMHEIAHFLLKHKPTRVDVSASGLLLLSEYSAEAEQEADCLAATMLLPRDALLLHRRRGETTGQIASAFALSEQLCEWRLRMSGVDLQLKRRRQYA